MASEIGFVVGYTFNIKMICLKKTPDLKIPLNCLFLKVFLGLMKMGIQISDSSRVKVSILTPKIRPTLKQKLNANAY